MNKDKTFIELDISKIENIDDINKILHKKLFLFSTNFDNYKIEADYILGNGHMVQRSNRYALINQEMFYKYICKVGFSILKNIDVNKLQPVKYYNSSVDTFICNLYILDVTLMNDQISNNILELVKSIGTFPFSTQKFYDVETNTYIIKNSVSEIASLCVITYLLKNLIEEDNQQYIELTNRIFNLKNETQYPTFENKCNTVLNFLNSNILIGNRNLSDFKFDTLNINKKIIPIYTTDNIFTFIWKELKQSITNAMIKYFDGNDYLTYKTYTCRECGEDFGDIIQTTNIKQDNFSNRNGRKKLCPNCKNTSILNSKEESEKKSFILYDEVKQTIEDLQSKGIEIPVSILKIFKNTRRDRAIRNSIKIKNKLEKIQKENDRN